MGSATDCRFFLQSYCYRGNLCSYRHCEAARRTNVPCPAYMYGQCTDLQCPRRHEYRNAPRYGQWHSNQYYQRNNFCPVENDVFRCLNVRCPYEHRFANARGGRNAASHPQPRGNPSAPPQQVTPQNAPVAMAAPRQSAKTNNSGNPTKGMSVQAQVSMVKDRGLHTERVAHSKRLVKKLSSSKDGDIAATSIKVSLLCPLGKSRMTVPCRAITCNHLQCFDAVMFLQLNEKKPKWKCPICNDKISFFSLYMDCEVFRLLEASPAASALELEEGSQWKVVGADSSRTSSEKTTAAGALDMSLVDLTTPAPVPPVSRIPEATGLTLPASPVVDLTASDDERSPMYKKKKSEHSVKPKRLFRFDFSKSSEMMQSTLDDDSITRSNPEDSCPRPQEDTSAYDVLDETTASNTTTDAVDNTNVDSAGSMIIGDQTSSSVIDMVTDNEESESYDIVDETLGSINTSHHAENDSLELTPIAGRQGSADEDSDVPDSSPFKSPDSTPSRSRHEFRFDFFKSSEMMQSTLDGDSNTRSNPEDSCRHESTSSGDFELSVTALSNSLSEIHTSTAHDATKKSGQNDNPLKELDLNVMSSADRGDASVCIMDSAEKTPPRSKYNLRKRASVKYF